MKKYMINAEGRVVALCDFDDVKVGEIGGFIESEKNLSHEGNCWIYGEARVFGDALVYENARVSGDAQVFGSALVSGDALVFGTAWVFESARVSGDARISEDAWVCGEARVFGNARVYGIRRSDGFRFCYVSCSDGNHRVIAGCRYFTMPEAREHWGTKHPKHEETSVILDALEGLSKVREEGCV